MYPFIRLITTTLQAKRMEKLPHPFDTTTVSFRIQPWDIDPYQELNNGRYLTLLDLGRFAHGNRIDLPKILKEQKWGLMVAAVSARFRYRITMFQKVKLHSKFIYYDERWFYFHQWFTTEKNGKEKINASFLVRTAVTSKQGLVNTAQVVSAMGFKDDELNHLNQSSEWIDSWAKSDDIHKVIMER